MNVKCELDPAARIMRAIRLVRFTNILQLFKLGIYHFHEIRTLIIKSHDDLNTLLNLII